MARVGSLIETRKMNCVEPYAWISSTVDKMAAGHLRSKSRMASLRRLYRTSIAMLSAIRPAAW